MILKLISGNKDIIIKASDGQRTIAQATEVFTGYIDSDFKDWGLDKPGKATPVTKVAVHEMNSDSKLKPMFKKLNIDLDKLCFTQNQIIDFVLDKDSRKWLHPQGYATFFLFKENGKYFVARVYFNSSDPLRVSVSQLEDGNVWEAESCHRVVVPELLVA